MACGPAVPNNQTFLHELRPYTATNAPHSYSHSSCVRLGNPGTWFERGRALALLAWLGTDAKSGVSSPDAATSAYHAVAFLRDAKSTGWVRRDGLLAGLVGGHQH